MEPEKEEVKDTKAGPLISNPARIECELTSN